MLPSAGFQSLATGWSVAGAKLVVDTLDLLALAPAALGGLVFARGPGGPLARRLGLLTRWSLGLDLGLRLERHPSRARILDGHRPGMLPAGAGLLTELDAAVRAGAAINPGLSANSSGKCHYSQRAAGADRHRHESARLCTQFA
jgi:hypothetical protein